MARVVIATAHHHILEHLSAALRVRGHEVVGVLSAGALPVMAEVVARVGCPRFELPLLPGELNIGRGMRSNPAYAEQVKTAAAELADLEADFLVGWAINVLPRFLLATARHPINVHPSDLPRYRGGFPLEAQILDGERKLYISVHHTVPRIDAGAVLARSRALKIRRSDTMNGLLAQIMPVGAAMLGDVVTGWGRLSPVPPPPVEDPLPHAWGIKRVRDADGREWNAGVLGRLRIEWPVDSARDIARAARAFDMIGGAFTNHGPHLFRITKAQTLQRTVSAEPGQVLALVDGGLEVQARDAVVRLWGRFAAAEGAIRAGERFVSTEPISRVLGLTGAER
ncbi:MAG: methionyl-tRNA formyltransferase [Myxococcota bacterium]|jgi:methionyl-tRNA formyltransferase